MDRKILDWHRWTSKASGQSSLRGGPGAMLCVSQGTPHAFASSTGTDVRMFFQATTHGGHENYFQELSDILTASDGRPSPDTTQALEQKYRIERVTALHDGS